MFVRSLLWLGAALALGAGVFLLSPAGRAWMDRASRVGSAFAHALRIGLTNRGPGIAELRSLGCARPLVMRADDLRGMSGLMAESSASRTAFSEIPGDETIVVCVQSEAATGPSCPEIAATYSAASKNTQPLWVIRSSGKAHCSGSYDPRTQEFRATEAPGMEKP
jgi:hypothetical protein